MHSSIAREVTYLYGSFFLA